MMNFAQAKAAKGLSASIPPISAVLAYHVEVLEAFEKAGKLKPDDFVAVQARAQAAYQALAGSEPGVG
jgi:hypothetical protein